MLCTLCSLKRPPTTFGTASAFRLKNVDVKIGGRRRFKTSNGYAEMIAKLALSMLLLFSTPGIIFAVDFTDNGNGTVTDKRTGLIWEQHASELESSDQKTWEEAITYCEELSLGAALDWRLPNVRELGMLIDFSRRDPASDATFFPNIKTSYYWTSTSYMYDLSKAWYITFYDGFHLGTYKTVSNYVRCVR